MTPAVQPGDTAQLLFSGARIPCDTFQAMRLADDVLREAHAAASQVRQQAVAMRDAQLRQAHAQGFAQGRAQAMIYVLGTLEVERRLRDLLTHRLADLVEHCVRSVLGEFGQPGLMRQRVLHLLRTAGSPPDVLRAPSTAAGIGSATLYVCSEQLPLVQKVATEMSHGMAGNIAGLIVVADDSRAPDSLLLETRVGFVESNITLALHEMRNLVQQSLDHATQALGELR
jgi:flagellar biosynthesis/type III secretory pathway protein FliH